MPRLSLARKSLVKGDLIGGEFEVVKKLGEGGAGSVYRCRWVKKPDAEVAVKVLDSADDLPRFLREAKVLSRIKHPNVVRKLGSGYHDQRPFIVLEYMDGGSVRDLLDSKGKLAVDEAAWVIIQTVRGLRAARTVHRDLKPENLLVGKGGKGTRLALAIGDIDKGAVIKVADFGLAKHIEGADTRLTNSGQVMGTPVYMSPEQCRNTRTVSVKTDIYALGIVFFEMVVGRPPFDGSNVYDIMAMHCNDEPKFPRLEARAKAIMARCLAKAPGKRYASLLALERDLSDLAGLGAPVADRSWGRSLTVLALLLALLALAAWALRAQWLPYVQPIVNW